jgi:hypothetical protein
MERLHELKKTIDTARRNNRRVRVTTARGETSGLILSRTSRSLWLTDVGQEGGDQIVLVADIVEVEVAPRPSEQGAAA